MWDDADMLNGCASVLYVFAIAALIGAGAYALIHSPLLPLRNVVLQGDLKHVTLKQAEAAARSGAKGTFLSVDLDAVRSAFEALPWVRKVEVRRIWPDSLRVSIEEHIAMAHWGGDAQSHQLVDTFGDVFDGDMPTGTKLPLLSGPRGSSQEVSQRYAAFRQTLAPLRLEPLQVQLSSRYSWRVQLSNGLTLELGRDQLKQPVLTRLARFVAYYAQTVGKLGRQFEYADLRYPSGFALRVPEIAHAVAPNKEPKHVQGSRGKA